MISKRIVILMLGATIAAAGLAIRSARSYAQHNGYSSTFPRRKPAARS